MKCEEVKINIPELIDGKLDRSVSEVVEAHIQSCEVCRETYTEFQSFLSYAASLPDIEPPKNMKDEFLMMAEMEGLGKTTKMLIVPDWLKAAAMIIVVFGTFAAGYFAGSGQTETSELRTEVQSLKQEVLLAGLRDYSGPQKIEAVYGVAQVENTNADLIDALVYTLNSDNNVNVRLASLTVLSGMINENESVKAELINSLIIQENPLIQISLIQILTESGVKEARKNIQLISDKESTDPSVKDYAENMIKTII